MGRLRNYLRFHRRRWQLTQQELAFLFGYSDQSIIARFEQEERAITLIVAHACGLIFEVEPSAIFPAIFDSIEQSLLARVREMHDELLLAEPTQRTLAKLELLRQALERSAASLQREV